MGLIFETSSGHLLSETEYWFIHETWVPFLLKAIYVAL